MDTTKSCFILSNRSEFDMINNLSIGLHAFARHMLTPLSVNEMLLPRYMNWSTNSRGLPLRVEMVPFYLKHMYSVLFAFTSRLMPPTACSRLLRRDSVWAGVFPRNTRSSVSLIISAGYHLPLIFFNVKQIFFIRSIDVQSTKSRQSINK